MAVQNTLPSQTQAEGGLAAVTNRLDNYGELVAMAVSNKELFSVVEGSHFVAVTPTPGTGIIGHAAPTTFDEAKPYIVIYNGHSSKTLYPQFLHLHETVASVGGARVQFTITTDVGNRRSSAGTAMTVSSTNTGVTNDATTVAYIGAVVGTAATSARRIIANVVFRGTIDIIEDDYQIVWGAPDGVGNSSSRVATVAEVSRVVPPMGIGPGSSMCITQWAAAQSTGPTLEAYFSYLLR